MHRAPDAITSPAIELESDAVALTPEPAATTAPRSRRAVLAAALAGVVGSVGAALGRPAETRAAAGDPLILGQTNYAGSAATRLNATSSGGAFWMTQNGFGSGVRGDSVNGHGGVFTTGHADRNGLLAQHTGAEGNGAAIRADGGENYGVYAVSADTAVYGESTGTGDGVSGFANTTGAGVRGVSAGGWGVYGLGATYAGFFDGRVYVAHSVELPEVMPPPSPNTNRARLFVRDNGVGKTQVCAQFSDGSIVVMATQP